MQLQPAGAGRRVLALVTVFLLVTGAGAQMTDDPWPGPATMQLEAGAASPGVEPVVRVFWPPPRVASLPTSYDFQVLDIDAADTTSIEITDLEIGVDGELSAVLTGRFAVLRRYVVRVRGKDETGVIVPWSGWSPVYAFELPAPDPGPDPGR